MQRVISLLIHNCCEFYWAVDYCHFVYQGTRMYNRLAVIPAVNQTVIHWKHSNTAYDKMVSFLVLYYRWGLGGEMRLRCKYQRYSISTCGFYPSMFTYVALVYYSGNQNVLTNDWYAFLHVLSILCGMYAYVYNYHETYVTFSYLRSKKFISTTKYTPVYTPHQCISQEIGVHQTSITLWCKFKFFDLVTTSA